MTDKYLMDKNKITLPGEDDRLELDHLNRDRFCEHSGAKLSDPKQVTITRMEAVMRQPIDMLIDLAKVFSSEVVVSKDGSDNFLVCINRVAYKNNHLDIMGRTIFGSGTSFDVACSDFLSKAKGKLLFGNDRVYYGENHPEYICL